MRLQFLFLILFIILPQCAFSFERGYDPKAGTDGLGLVELKLGSEGEPPSAKFRNDLGIACAADNKPYEAIAEFEKAYRLSPGDAAIAFNLGVAHARVENHTEALKYLREAVKICPDNAAALFNIGVIHLGLGAISSAIGELERALLLSPGHPLIHYNLGIAYENDEDGIRYGQGFPAGKALEHYYKAIDGGLDNAATRYNIGIVHSKSGDYEKAIAEFTKACELAPDFLHARRNLALALVHLGKYHRAIRELEGAIAVSNDPALASPLAFAYRELGAFYLENGDYERALAQFRNALRYNEDDAVAHLNIGKIDTVLGDYNAALRALEIASKLDPELDTGGYLAKAYFLRGMEFEKKGYYLLAFAEYRKAVKTNQDFTLAHLIMGDLCADKLGRRDEAMKYFKRCLELEPEGSYSKLAEEKISALRISSGTSK